MENLTPDLCVIGAGSGGLTAAAAAAQLGLSVVLIEKALMGGDCLNYGCVPSKALLASAKRAEQVRNASDFGIEAGSPRTDWDAVRARVRRVIAEIEPNDSVARFEGLGVHVIKAEARFTCPTTLVAGEHEIEAWRYIVAAGSEPAVPSIEGIEATPYLTNETLFSVEGPVGHLIIVGGGPIGMEMAQAHRRLGGEVTVIESERPFAKDDTELARILIRRLEREGVALIYPAKVERVAREGDGVTVEIAGEAGAQKFRGTHLLIATGRKYDFSALGLDAAGVRHGKGGIEVDDYLQTANSRIYAIGDATGRAQFTHAAGYHAGIAIRNIVFRLWSKANAPIPHVTYCDPELAQVGLTEDEAREKGIKFGILRAGFSENDRGHTDGETEGHIKLITRGGKLIGAGIVGAHAGELIAPYALAIAKGVKIGDLAGLVLPYPTLSETGKKAAVSAYLPALTNPWLRRIIRALRSFS